MVAPRCGVQRVEPLRRQLLLLLLLVLLLLILMLVLLLLILMLLVLVLWRWHAVMGGRRSAWKIVVGKLSVEGASLVHHGGPHGAFALGDFEGGPPAVGVVVRGCALGPRRSVIGGDEQGKQGTK